MMIDIDYKYVAVWIVILIVGLPSKEKKIRKKWECQIWHNIAGNSFIHTNFIDLTCRADHFYLFFLVDRNVVITKKFIDSSDD